MTRLEDEEDSNWNRSRRAWSDVSLNDMLDSVVVFKTDSIILAAAWSAEERVNKTVGKCCSMCVVANFKSHIDMTLATVSRAHMDCRALRHSPKESG